MSAVNVPFEIPASWRWVRLIEIAEVLGGSTPPKESISSCGVPYFKVAEMNLPGNEKYLRHTSLFVSPSCKIRRFPASTIVFPKNGGALLTNKKRILMNESICDLNTGGIALHSTEILKYAYYWFYSIDLHDFLTGGVIPTINAVAFRNQQFPLPPLAEQKRIVAKIEELFAIADSLGAAADGLENAAKRLDKKILDLAIRGRLVPQDPNDEPASELVKRIAASHKSPSKNQSEPIDPPFEIPGSWKWVRLKELGVFCGGHTPSTSNPKLWGGDILWVSSKDMKSKYIDDTQIKVTRLGAEELNVLKPGALLMCTRSGILRRVFPVAIARRELTINQDQRALTLWLPEMIEYVYLALKSLESIILSDYKKSGTTVESIIWNKFVDLPIPLPPLNEQKRIVKRVEELKATTRTLVTF